MTLQPFYYISNVVAIIFGVIYIWSLQQNVFI